MSKANTSYELVILVVEDEFLVRDIIVCHLRDAGCLVLEARSGEQAMELLHPSRAIDVLFTDIELGGDLSGWDVGEAYRAAQREIGVIYTSGHLTQHRRSVSGSLFFNKPYRIEQVLDACRGLCS